MTFKRSVNQTHRSLISPVWHPLGSQDWWKISLSWEIQHLCLCVFFKKRKSIIECLNGDTETAPNSVHVQPDALWQRVSGCCMSSDGVLCHKLCHKSEGTCTQGTRRWWQCSYLRLQDIDRWEENYKEKWRERVSERERQRSAFLLCLPWWISWGGAIWHLSPNQPGTITSRGRTGDLLGSCAQLPVKKANVWRSLVLQALSSWPRPSRWTAGFDHHAAFFVNCTGTAHKL